jgi:ATP-dependent DNA ligase
MNKNEIPVSYETLYSRDSLGRIRVWWMERLGNKYRTNSGIKDVDSSLVTSEWTVTEPKNVGKKNSTTGDQQADSEVKNKYKKQLKTGYTKDIKKVDNAVSYVEPMLANKYKDRIKKINFTTQNWAIQCKFNGNRCVATKDGLKTRKGEKYISVPHISDALIKFFEKHPNSVLDGELFNNDLREQLNELNKCVRKTVNVTEEVLKRSEQIVRYYVYDGYGWEDTDENTPYSLRKEWIDKNIVGKVKYVEKVKTDKIKSEKDLNEKYQSYVDDGQEGAILRDLDGGYEHKRSNNLLKFKPEDDDEALILDITDGDGNWAGAATNVTLKWNDKVFDGVFKGKYEVRAEILKNKKNWIGKTVTFLYMGLTGLGTPNFARVDPSNCFKIDK